MNPPAQTPPQVLPRSIERLSPHRIAIVWSDGVRAVYEASRLREACPCATCREKRQARQTPTQPLGLPVLSVAETQPIAVARMTPVGNYAYNIAFSDGHDSGIYVFEFLYEIGTRDAPGEADAGGASAPHQPGMEP